MSLRATSFLGLVCLLAACRAPHGARAAPVPAVASAALAEARNLVRGGQPDAPEVAAALARARAAAPDWVAPLRLEDDLALRARLAVEALEARRARWRADPSDAGAAYLIGRLEGASGAPRFERALELDRDLAWAHHGLAWFEARKGRTLTAYRTQARAVELARDPWERAFFTVTRAQYALTLDRREDALELVRAELDRPQTSRADRLWIETEVALVELRQRDRAERFAGQRRALELLHEVELADVDVMRLAASMRGMTLVGEAREAEFELALAARRGPVRDRLRAELMLYERPTPIAAMLLEASSAGGDGDDVLGRQLRFAAGGFQRAVESWLAGLPPRVLTPAGLPRDARLAQVVESARALDEGSRAAALGRFGEALIAAGWFTEARAVAEEIAADDLAAALALRDKALAGLDLVDAMGRALIELRSEERRTGDEAARDLRRDNGGLDALLDHFGVLFANANGWLGGETEARRLSAELLASPRLHYGPFASVVHPGERYSREDQGNGLGLVGEPVGGLALQMARIGRFAILGEYLGGGSPDGVILPRLLVEERSGEHLGVPWQGTIAWCEGADVGARATRAGARVAGAALHEGYWIDIEPVRRDLAGWNTLARVYSGPGARARVERVLATRGLALETPPGHERARRDERRRIVPALGAADRVRIALLRERAAGADESRPLGLLEFEELLDAVGRHEEGHLCDRTLFLPLGRNLGRALRLLLDEGFSPARVMRRLEYRAQLLALCVVADPRISLVDLLHAAEVDDDGPLPHGEAYRELLRDLVALLDEECEREPAAWPAIDRERTLVHQLHHLRPGELRGLALKLARRKGVGRL